MKEFGVTTRKRHEFVDITGDVARIVKEEGLMEGTVVVFVPHTTAGVTINEGADPAVALDIVSALKEVVPEDFDYHHLEGNSPAHIKATLTGSSVQVIVSGARMCLGTWQKVFFCEYDGPRNRKVWVQTLGDRKTAST